MGAGVVRLAEQTYEFDIPSKPLPRAIADFSAVTGLQVLYNVDNLFDENYVEGVVFGPNFIEPGAPRSLFDTVQVKF